MEFLFLSPRPDGHSEPVVVYGLLHPVIAFRRIDLFHKRRRDQFALLIEQTEEVAEAEQPAEEQDA